MKRRSLIGVALATLFLPVLSSADEAVYDLGEAKLTVTPSLSAWLGTNNFGEEDKLGQLKFGQLFDSTLSYSLSASATGKLTHPSFGAGWEILLGIDATLSGGNATLNGIFEGEDFAKLSAATASCGEIYAGVGSPFGIIKYGKLNDPGYSGIGSGTIYGRTGGLLVTNSIRYESPALHGFKLTVLKSNVNRAKGFEDTNEASDQCNYQLALEKDDKDNKDNKQYAFYSTAIDYSAGDFFARYTGAFTEDGLKKGTEKSFATAHRIEGGFSKGGLRTTLGYKRTVSNTGWGTDLHGLDTDLTKQDAQKVDYFDEKQFTTSEFVVSTSYNIGSFTPKAAIIYGAKATEKNKKEVVIPGYLELAAGVDYMINEQVSASFNVSQLTWSHDKVGDFPHWKNQKTYGLGVSYQF